MKKSLLLGLLGLAAAAVTSYGQGSIKFNTYQANGGSGLITTYGTGVAGHAANSPIGSTFTAGLYYSTSSITDAAGVDTPAGGVWTDSLLTAQFQTSAGNQAGYFIGAQNFVLPSYTGSASVYFEVLAYNGSSWANSTVRGHSAAFSQTLATGTSLPGYMDSMPLFQVFTVVPEPSTIALAGIGLAGLLAFRRRS